MPIVFMSPAFPADPRGALDILMTFALAAVEFGHRGNDRSLPSGSPGIEGLQETAATGTEVRPRRIARINSHPFPIALRHGEVPHRRIQVRPGLWFLHGKLAPEPFALTKFARLSHALYSPDSSVVFPENIQEEV